MPAADSDLAQELTKDPYDFAFTGVTRPYNERILKDALLRNITRFLTELGTGFAYGGKRVKAADRRDGELYRSSFLQSQSFMLCRDRSENRKV